VIYLVLDLLTVRMLVCLTSLLLEPFSRTRGAVICSSFVADIFDDMAGCMLLEEIKILLIELRNLLKIELSGDGVIIGEEKLTEHQYS
jgi:hypothetical protein